MNTWGMCFLLASAAAISFPQTSLPENRNWGIVESSKDQVLNPGQTISLYCRVGGDGITENDDWKECTWRREVDGASCNIYYQCSGSLCGVGVGDFSQVMYCDNKLSDATFYGDDPNVQNKMCGINVPNASYEDDSPWTCIIEECDFVGCGTDDGNGEYSQATIEVYVN